MPIDVTRLIRRSTGVFYTPGVRLPVQSHLPREYRMTLRSTRARVTGFTLVELLITLMIATILMTLAVPQFTSLVANSRLTTQSNDMIAAINFARSTAIKRNGSVFLCRASSATATDCVTSQAQWTHWIIRTGAGNVVRRGTINTHGGKLRVTSGASPMTPWSSVRTDSAGRTARCSELRRAPAPPTAPAPPRTASRSAPAR